MTVSISIKKLVSCGFLACTFGILSLFGCSTESRHRTIVYDEAWSSAAAMKNLICSPEKEVACKREAVEQERSFAQNLPAAFQKSPKCSTVSFLIARADAPGIDSAHWRLRVDFHPRLATQTFELGPGTDRPHIGGDDVEHNAAYICEAVKNNGVTAIW